MTTERFWVIGGEFGCTGFKALRDGAGQVAGPFSDRDAAQAEWRRLSGEHSSRATTRYSIAVEKLVLPN